ncbi:MAG: hypothetical protein H7Y11_09095 [Armatimonadetes bacterium]|nr:hypothetical protein [Anaerolineae bacterium]
MEKAKIIETLGLISGGSFFITEVLLLQWGRELEFEFDYQTVQPDGTPDAAVTFMLIFRDCRDFKWRSYAHIALSEMGDIALRTELVEIAFGQGNHRRDANLLTNHFAATLSYGDVVVDYHDQFYPLSR